MSLHATGLEQWRRCEAFLKAGATRLLAQPPITAALRNRQTRDGAISVLVYHTLGPDGEDFDAWTVLEEGRFRAHMAMLRAHYDIVSLDEAVQSWGTPARRPRAVLTFDDGERGLHAHLLPIVDELGIPVTIYVATGHIEAQEPYWFDAIMNATQTTAPLVIDLSEFGLSPVTIGATRGPRNWLAIAKVLEHLKYLPAGRRTAAVRDVLRQTANGARPPFTPMRPLTVAELQDVARHPLVTIGAHTHCHSLLDQVTLAEAEASVQTSLQRLREWTGRTIDHFAYPNGNFSAPLDALMAEIGFRTAAIGGGKLWNTSNPAFSVPRVPVGRYDTAERLALRLVGV